jgi:hypothetical protein
VLYLNHDTANNFLCLKLNAPIVLFCGWLIGLYLNNFHDCFGFHTVLIHVGLMHSGTYFSNFIAGECTRSVNYGIGQPENMEMPVKGVGQPDDTPASNELPTQDDPHGAAKEKKRSKNFNVDEDKLLASGWLNVAGSNSRS